MEGVVRQLRHAVKAGGECRKVGVRRPQLGCGCLEATDMAEEIGHVVPLRRRVEHEIP